LNFLSLLTIILSVTDISKLEILMKTLHR
jgi:hypothetical protein